jgi:DMSO/TMAO reductase YedYZ molybdopterin-dependent catalytic subunit
VIVGPSPHRALVGGAIAGSAALFVLLLARLAGGPPGILESIADSTIRSMPPWLFDWGVKSLGTLAKGLLFGAICLGVPVIGAALAAVLNRARLMGQGRPVLDLLVLATAALALGEFVVLPLAGAGFAGSTLRSDTAAVHVPVVVASLLYGSLVAGWLLIMEVPAAELPVRRSPPAPEQGAGPAASNLPLSRRAFLTRAMLIVGATSVFSSILIVAARLRPPAPAALPGSVDAPGSGGYGFVRAVTPVPEFYFVSKDWVAMEIDPATWRLHVSGLVAAPRAWTLDELRLLPQQEAYRTLQCISAESVTRSTLIGNQRWAGARVRDVLAASAPGPTARYIVWRCADGYHESTDLETALADDTWLVYEMGPPGTLLTPEHGRPLRLLVAGRYGMAQPKYVTDLIVSDTDEPGWWVRGGWRTDAPVRTYCRIDLPAADGISDSVIAGRPFTAYGVASSGDRGISAVQVSTDGGDTWRSAELEPLGGPIGRLTWVRWRADVRLDKPGPALFMARAADGSGAWQEAALSEPFPAGASGYPRVPMRAYASLSDPGPG